MDAKKILKKMDYIPRWLWYVGSLFVAPPISTLAVWLTFHILGKMAKEQEEQEAAGYGTYQTAEAFHPEGTVRGDGYEVRTAGAREAKKTWAEERPAHSYDPIDPDAGVDEVLRQGREAMQRIREANDAIPDPVLSSKIDSIENSCDAILDMLEQRPELLPQLRTFLRYYLPTTLKLLDARARLDDAGTPKGREVRRRIGVAMDQIDRAFRNQIESLEEYRFVDLESEMDVLTDMLRADGLLDEEEEKEKPLAMGGH